MMHRCPSGKLPPAVNGGIAAVYDQFGAGHVPGFVRGEEQAAVGDIDGLAHHPNGISPIRRWYCALYLSAGRAAIPASTIGVRINRGAPS